MEALKVPVNTLLQLLLASLMLTLEFLNVIVLTLIMLRRGEQQQNCLNEHHLPASSSDLDPLQSRAGAWKSKALFIK